jgi:hypothetical protein
VQKMRLWLPGQCLLARYCRSSAIVDDNMSGVMPWLIEFVHRSVGRPIHAWLDGIGPIVKPSIRKLIGAALVGNMGYKPDMYLLSGLIVGRQILRHPCWPV